MKYYGNLHCFNNDFYIFLSLVGNEDDIVDDIETPHSAVHTPHWSQLARRPWVYYNIPTILVIRKLHDNYSILWPFSPTEETSPWKHCTVARQNIEISSRSREVHLRVRDEKYICTLYISYAVFFSNFFNLYSYVCTASFFKSDNRRNR